MTSVLFVSHDGDLCAVATRVLQRAGCRVTAAAHGGHALLACADRGTFDVVVIENELPEGPGHVVAQRLRRRCPDVHVVRMCDDTSTPTLGEGVALVRPFVADDLIDAVQALRRTITR